LRWINVLNLATEADLANGTRGTIEGIILDPREGNCEVSLDGSVMLKLPPAMIIFKPDNVEKLPQQFTEQFANSRRKMPKNTVSLTPSTKSFTMCSVDRQTYTVYHCQYALTAGYAFTDIKS
jgi:hypothetical protein